MPWPTAAAASPPGSPRCTCSATWPWAGATGRRRRAARRGRRVGERMRELQRLSPAWWGLAEMALLARRPGRPLDWCERGYAASARVARRRLPLPVRGDRDPRLPAAGDRTGARDWLDAAPSCCGSAASRARWPRSTTPGAARTWPRGRPARPATALGAARPRSGTTAAGSGRARRRCSTRPACAARSRRPAEAADLAAGPRRAPRAGATALRGPRRGRLARAAPRGRAAR